MPELYIQEPESLSTALERMRPESLMTIATFLLTAGLWQSRAEGTERVLVRDDMEALGLSDWHIENWVAVDELSFDEFQLAGEHLAESIFRAYRSKSSLDLARAVLCGLDHADDLVRACALRSALEMFRFRIPDVFRRLRGFFSSKNEIAYAIASIATSQNAAAIMSSQSIYAVHPSSASPSCVALVHGTNFPPGRPAWSVPGSGPLFSHIATLRSDIYRNADYFRWEGGYSDYAREVAAYNLNDWILRRNLQGLDVVAHSHGCNVLFAATQLGVRINRAVLLSCPVHWRTYHPAPGSIVVPQSIRVRMDLVILADRGHQRFPSGTIPEEVLPYWFDHRATTDPGVWILRNLDRFI